MLYRAISRPRWSDCSTTSCDAVRTVVCHEYGPPEVLSVEDVPVPVPGRGEVLVDVAAAAVNFPDVLIVADRYQVSVPLPFTPGSEFAGTVIAIGPRVDSWNVGDRVFGSSMSGSFSEMVAVDQSALRRVPVGVDVRKVAGFWVAYATSYHALRSVAEVGPGDRVVVLGAAGGVGLAAVELAAILGAEVIAAASSAEKLALCQERGSTHTIDYATVDLRETLRELAPAGVDAVIDPVGGPMAERALRAVRWGGRYVTVGFASGEIPRIPLNLVLLKGVIVKGFEIRTFARYAPELAHRDERELLELLASGRLVPHISSEYPLERAADALQEVADRRAVGKVLVVPSPG
jgi:NADPH2:quinone reductase